MAYPPGAQGVIERNLGRPRGFAFSENNTNSARHLEARLAWWLLSCGVGVPVERTRPAYQWHRILRHPLCGQHQEKNDASRVTA